MDFNLFVDIIPLASPLYADSIPFLVSKHAEEAVLLNVKYFRLMDSCMLNCAGMGVRFNMQNCEMSTVLMDECVQ